MPDASGLSVSQVSMGKQCRDDSSPSQAKNAGRGKCPLKAPEEGRQWGMGKSAPESDFNAVFRLRTKQAREKAGLTQAQVAAALDVDVDKYKKWENRETSAVPRDKMYAFAIVARCDLAWLLSPPTRQELALARPKERLRA